MPRNHHEGAGEQVHQEQRGVHHVGGGVNQNVKHISADRLDLQDTLDDEELF